MKASDSTPTCPDTVLNHSPLAHLRRLVVTVSEAEVIITGKVPSYYLKQLAQETVRPTLGERRLLNRVEVSAA